MKLPDSRHGISRGFLELVTAGALGAWGCLLMIDSRRMGAGWTPEGPAPGYFSHHIGLLLALTAAGIALRTLGRADRRTVVASYAQLFRVATLFIPTAICVAAIPELGLALSSAVFLFCCLRYGGFTWAASVAGGIAVFVAMILIFEVWFRLPLPKGPLEALLGF